MQVIFNTQDASTQTHMLEHSFSLTGSYYTLQSKINGKI